MRLTANLRFPALSAIVGLHLLAATAWAQKPGAPSEEVSSMMPWLIGVGLAALMLFPAFLNPKRSHQN